MNIEETLIILSVLDDNFDSHDFIREYINRLPSSYGELLIKHNNVNLAHAEIANFLRTNANILNIHRIGATESNDIFGNKAGCAKWEKFK